MAYELNKAKDKAVLKDDVFYVNRRHHVISMPFPSSSDLNLYIDAKTSLISKMVRQIASVGDLSYVFSGHTKVGDLTSDTSINFFVDGQPSIISTEHSLMFNQSIDASSVALPDGLRIVTHHHSDHIGGLGEAVQLGARLLTVADNIDTIKQSISPATDQGSFYQSGARSTLGSGRERIEVYEVSTSHAASFLVMYAVAEKTVFIADHFGSPFAKGLPTANLSSVEMLNQLEKLDIDIDKISTAHNARIFTIKELRDSAAAYKEVVCSAKRPVCL